MNRRIRKTLSMASGFLFMLFSSGICGIFGMSRAEGGSAYGTMYSLPADTAVSHETVVWKAEETPIFLEENVNVNFLAEIPDAGEYYVQLTYVFLDTETTQADLEVTVDEDIRTGELTAVYQIEDDVQLDISGNQRRPKLRPVICGNLTTLQDGEGKAQFWSLESGVHDVTLKADKPIRLHSFCLIRKEKGTVPYEEQWATWCEAGYQVQEESLYLEAEAGFRSSASAVSVMNDRSSSKTSPVGYKQIRYNTVGSNWNQCGQWIEWNIKVEKAGLYAIGMRWRQQAKTNAVSYRSLTIDGQAPFEEAKALEFAYNSSWQVSRLGGSKERPEGYYVYLSEGTHTLRLEAVMGDYEEFLGRLEEQIMALNSIYRQIIMVTGSSLDVNRDYQFEKRIPATLQAMQDQQKQLLRLRQELQELTAQEDGEGVSLLSQICRELAEMSNDSYTIAYHLSEFESNISALSAWMLGAKEQPLEIDYLFLDDGKQKLPKAEAGFFSSVYFLVDQFLYSFVRDYDAVGQCIAVEGEPLTVWMGTSAGRDQASILSELITDYFTPENEIAVNLQLVSGTALLPAVLADLGPDVALGMAQADPVNYALRGAANDLSVFPDCSQVVESFSTSSTEPFRFHNALYALPETQTFPLLFYRTDILNELGITEDALQEWDNILQAVLPKLQESHLQFGILPTIQNYGMLLYQNGGSFYNADLTASELDKTVAVKTFSWFTTLYTDYKLDISYDLANRFRTGEMPMPRWFFLPVHLRWGFI